MNGIAPAVLALSQISFDLRLIPCLLHSDEELSRVVTMPNSVSVEERAVGLKIGAGADLLRAQDSLTKVNKDEREGDARDDAASPYEASSE